MNKLFLLALLLVAPIAIAAQPAAPALVPTAQTCAVPGLIVIGDDLPAGPYCPGDIDAACLAACVSSYRFNISSLNTNAINHHNQVLTDLTTELGVCSADLAACQSSGGPDCFKNYSTCLETAWCAAKAAADQVQATLDAGATAAAATFYACVANCCIE